MGSRITRNGWFWFVWGMIGMVLAAYFYRSLTDSDRTVFLPGATSDGHHQIESVCEACHGEAFTDADAMQKACESCHGEQLKVAKDKHPKSKFTDPRNAERTAILDARYCVTCHVEHRPEMTLAMGVTMPKDYCHLCHDDIAEDRPSHAGMAFDTCDSAGCHNFHDNRALYEDFLVQHAHEPDLLDAPLIDKKPNFVEVAALTGTYPLERYPLRELRAEDSDAPEALPDDPQRVSDWLASAHAKAGVNCSACHIPDRQGVWNDHPDHTACAACHDNEARGFLLGKHGMRLDGARLKKDLAPMGPARARLPMKARALDKTLDCGTCHKAHRFDTVRAAVDGCLGCHDDRHSVAFTQSPHYRLWEQEQSGHLAPGRGVSCATCHMPRIEKGYFEGEVKQVLVEHNQSDTLRPSDKMIRPVCMSCHGLGFAIDALADPRLIDNNFSGAPAKHIASLEMAEKRTKDAKAKRKSGACC